MSSLEQPDIFNDPPIKTARKPYSPRRMATPRSSARKLGSPATTPPKKTSASGHRAIELAAHAFRAAI